jgi:hypothetical protein
MDFVSSADPDCATFHSRDCGYHRAIFRLFPDLQRGPPLEAVTDNIHEVMLDNICTVTQTEEDRTISQFSTDLPSATPQ